MRQGRLVATGVMLAFCLFAAWQSWLLPLTDRLGPGPGFFPFWMALIGVVLAIGLLVATVGEPAAAPVDGEAERILPSGPGAGRWFAIVLMLAAAAAAMEVLGFRITMLAFNAALAVALGERRWWVIALFAVLGSVGVFYVFTTWLDVLLPVGRFGI
ncbi:MAG: tripartite tricarboxylate transporter TctB family protein [Alphaproteobacteria bacterium]|nr:tripartite tricarboxylate transporter TctB family protein [Alphaproteobacteria bacterium]MCW5743587.1 tripartite tricarboxylate transporter TctB family protein [Alphaproteobacteria bacterium]